LIDEFNITFEEGFEGFADECEIYILFILKLSFFFHVVPERAWSWTVWACLFGF
jgi:hypothetical protein